IKDDTRSQAAAYQFTFRIRNGRILVDTAEWYGDSKDDHPDFAWYPTGVRWRNTEVDYETVRKIVAPGQSEPGQDPELPRGGLPPVIAEILSGHRVAVSPRELVALLACKTSSF